MKLIFVTGGVISGLGKGITAASIGRMMKSAGYSVSMMKLDPYLQIDAGTMSPYEHGEVFVTEDGGETDLDLGHYERFVDENLTKQSSVTTGQIYLSVINKERKGDYLGKTVQVIPHVIDEVKARIFDVAKDKDVTIIEIGGTVGDIEGPHFLEAMRQLKYDLGKDNVMYVHVVPLLYLQHSDEFKTKAIQHSVIKLREIGIQADFLVCRSHAPVTEDIKQKLALFCDIDPSRIIEALDQQSIYQVPLCFQEQGFGIQLQKRLFSKTKKADLKEWNKRVHNLLHPSKEVHICFGGKYGGFDDCDLSLMEALKHAGTQFDTKVTIHKLDPESVADSQTAEEKIAAFIKKHNIDGMIMPGGFGSRGIEGMINMANYARKHKLPYLGICLGLQVAVIAFARAACQLPEANSTEFNTETPDPVVDIMEHQKTVTKKGGTMRLGAYPAVLEKGTVMQKLYKENNISERHRHRYEVNPDYHTILQNNGLTISGMSPDKKLVEFIEFADHPYCVATQAHPELKSRLYKPHPLFVGLIKASLGIK